MQLSSSVSTRLQYQHKSLMDILDAVSDEQIRRQIITGKWSVFENIVHLQTYQHRFADRIKQILSTDNPVFTRYSAESDPLFLDNCGKSSREIIKDLLTFRKEMAAEIILFPGSDLIKPGTHPVYGKLSLIQWLHFFLLHEAHHLLTIFKLTSEVKKTGI